MFMARGTPTDRLAAASVQENTRSAISQLKAWAAERRRRHTQPMEMPPGVVNAGLSLGGVVDDRLGSRLCIHLIQAARIGPRELFDLVLTLR